VTTRLLGRGQGLLLPRRPAARVAVASDTFTRADSTTTLGTSSSGHAWTTFGQGTGSSVWGISSNKAYMVSVVSANDYGVVLDAGRADATVAADLTLIAGATMGLTLRYVDANNYLAVRMVQSTGVLSLVRNVAAARSVSNLATGLTFTAGNTFRLRAALTGPYVVVSIDGVQRGQSAETSHLAATRHGLYSLSVGTTRAFDNFEVAA
jgi:hypothetical protein